MTAIVRFARDQPYQNADSCHQVGKTWQRRRTGAKPASLTRKGAGGRLKLAASRDTGEGGSCASARGKATLGRREGLVGQAPLVEVALHAHDALEERVVVLGRELRRVDEEGLQRRDGLLRVAE